MSTSVQPLVSRATTAAEAWETLAAITEVHERLRNREVTLQTAITTTPFPVSANVAQYHRRSDYNNNNNYTYRNHNRSSRSNSNNNNWLYLGKCQICHTQRHSARRCPQLHSIQASAPPRYNTSFTPWQPRANMVATTSPPAISDSGATHHITSDLNNLAIHQPYNGGDDLTIAYGSTMPITHTGEGSLYGVPLLQGRTANELYQWPMTSPNVVAMMSAAGPRPSLLSWHYCLGHPTSTILHAITSPILSHQNYKYYLIVVDHFTRYTWFYPLKRKSDVKKKIIAYKALVENRFQTRLGTLFTDNGGEFIALRRFLSTYGVSHLTSPPYTPEHNGVSERKHHHIVETGLMLMSTASVPKRYWPYAFATAVFLFNRMPTPVLSMQSPFQKLCQTSPNYAKRRVFGCLCFPWLRPYAHHKLDDRSQRCVFLGYSMMQSAYYFLHVPTGRVYTSRHVQFIEDVFPFRDLPKLPATTDSVSPAPVPHSPVLVQLPLVAPSPAPPPLAQQQQTQTHHPTTNPAQPTNNVVSPSSPTASPPPSLGPLDSNLCHSTSKSSQVLSSKSSSSSSPSPTEPTAPQENEMRPTSQPLPKFNEPTTPPQNELRPTTQPRPQTNIVPHRARPIQPQNQTTTIEPPQNNHNMQTRAKNRITKPNTKLSLHVVASPISLKEPTTIAQALKDPNWSPACSKEYDALTINHTWDLVPPNAHQNIVGCKWVFTTKFHANGVLDRYKSRLVAKGFHQQYGKDYAETFSLVIKSTTIRLVLDVAVKKSRPLKQLDVNNAFLQGDLTEEVYMSQPPGFVDKDRPHHVCRLRKPIYGLKQAPRAWCMALKQHLLDAGFTNSLAMHLCLFTALAPLSLMFWSMSMT
ncbi:PREDICTED: uncharacterized protein LOC104728255 [Camelina sativa]|uniref:Uncharacterized protein LOC104728255 n=1 Tax=Camelina sativa TaxID=90675 RepID=A0ABM0USJ5_CAMSA|nr:PREDICTED: uncharacterized protein LOC104728255 [Camelina sativa]